MQGFPITLIVCGWLSAGAAVMAQGARPSAAAVVTVLRADFGLVAPPGSAQPTFLPSSTVPLQVDQGYGWVIRVRTPLRTVRVHEVLSLPAAPATWGDPEPGLKRRVSADERTATTETVLPVRDGVVSQSWAVAPGDPAGRYVLRVRIEDAPQQSFTFTVR
jgi:hypothetical protein